MRVALLMGSDSDFPRLDQCVNALKRLQIPFEARVLSAHRAPERLVEYIRACNEGDIGVFLCAAGGAAHLAGVVAAHTDKPVIGIPMDNPPLGGIDALLATVQMPAGIPVATVAVGGGGPMNAALIAARILALSDPELAARYVQFREDQAERVLKKDQALQRRL